MGECMFRWSVKRRLLAGFGVLALLGLLLLPRQSSGYIEVPMSLGYIIQQSVNIVVLEVEKVDNQRNIIHFKKVKDLKGVHSSERVVQNIAEKGFHPREWQTIMAWAKPGKKALFFHNGRASETCIDTYWYQCYGNGENWRMSHAEPYLLRSFAGRPERLRKIVEVVDSGEETIAPCMVDSDDKEELQLRKARMQRLRVGYERLDYDPERDFVGWGSGELEDLPTIAGFTHIAPLPRVDPGAVGVSLGDYDADGKLDICLFGDKTTRLLRNEGKAFSELELPFEAPARSAAWADFDGDGRKDLLLATSAGPRLLSGTAGEGGFRDESDSLPAQPAWNLTCAVWVDVDQDSWPDILLANGFYGLRLLLNRPGPPGARRWVDGGKVDVPIELLDAAGPRQGKGDYLVQADINSDGLTDVLYCAGRGILLLGRKGGFEVGTGHGIDFLPGGIGPAFGDFDSDGDPDLFVPAGGFGRLLENDGRGRFHDVTTRLADVLPQAQGRATSAAWADFDCDGRLDLLLSVRGGFNRVLLNRGGGRLVDRTIELGLDRRIFNSQALAAADVDGDGDLDLVYANEGQEPCVLFAAPHAPGPRFPVEVVFPGAQRAAGASLAVYDLSAGSREENTAPLHRLEIGRTQGRGCQDASRARMGLGNGLYQLEVRYSSGRVKRQTFEVAGSHLFLEVRP